MNIAYISDVTSCPADSEVCKNYRKQLGLQSMTSLYNLVSKMTLDNPYIFKNIQMCIYFMILKLYQAKVDIFFFWLKDLKDLI